MGVSFLYDIQAQVDCDFYVIIHTLIIQTKCWNHSSFADDVDGSACVHLEELLKAASDAILTESIESIGLHGGKNVRPDLSLPLTLVGFSKGIVVLNQLVTELAAPGGIDTQWTKRVSSTIRSRSGGGGSRAIRKRPRASTKSGHGWSSCGSGVSGTGDSKTVPESMSPANGEPLRNWSLPENCAPTENTEGGPGREETGEETYESPQVCLPLKCPIIGSTGKAQRASCRAVRLG